MGDSNNLGKFDFFFEKKVDNALKTAFGRCGRGSKGQKNKRILGFV